MPTPYKDPYGDSGGDWLLKSDKQKDIARDQARVAAKPAQKPAPKAVVPSDPVKKPDVAAQVSTLQNKAIVRPDNPPRGIAGFLFDIRQEETIELNSDITDHYVEDNTAIQDQVALKPEMITLRGLVAELSTHSPTPEPFITPPDPLPANIPMMPEPSAGTLATLVNSVVTQNVQNGALQVLSGVSPRDAISGIFNTTKQQTVAGIRNKVSNAANFAIRTLIDPTNASSLLQTAKQLPQAAQNAVQSLKTLIPKSLGSIFGALKTPTTPASKQLLSSAKTADSDDVNSLFEAYKARQTTPPNQSLQTSAFLYFYGLWQNRAQFSVETPWGLWNSMSIQSLRANQPEETKDATDFTIVFKKIRFAQNVKVQVGQLSGRLVAQASASTPAQNGTVGQTAVTPTQKQTILRQFAETIMAP